MSTKKKLIVISSIIVFLLLATFFVIKILDKNKRTMNGNERIAYTTLRLTESSSALNKVSEHPLNSAHMKLLKDFVKKVDSKNQWFSKNSGYFYGKYEDTSDIQVTWISDGTYTAKFYIKNWGMEYVLEKYTFTSKTETEKGYGFTVEESDKIY